jgi:hypothetical protein
MLRRSAPSPQGFLPSRDGFLADLVLPPRSFPEFDPLRIEGAPQIWQQAIGLGTTVFLAEVLVGVLVDVLVDVLSSQ